MLSIYTQFPTMPPKKRERGGLSPRVTMGGSRRAPAYVCPNPLCKQVLPSQSGLTNHFLHFTTCGNVNTSVLAILEDAQQADTDRETSLAQATSELDPCVHSNSEEEATDYRFDFVEDYPENEAEPDVVDDQEDANARLADRVVHVRIKARLRPYDTHDYPTFLLRDNRR
jgi:hypothetical protein